MAGIKIKLFEVSGDCEYFPIQESSEHPSRVIRYYSDGGEIWLVEYFSEAQAGIQSELFLAKDELEIKYPMLLSFLSVAEESLWDKVFSPKRTAQGVMTYVEKHSTLESSDLYTILGFGAHKEDPQGEPQSLFLFLDLDTMEPADAAFVINSISRAYGSDVGIVQTIDLPPGSDLSGFSERRTKTTAA